MGHDENKLWLANVTHVKVSIPRMKNLRKYEWTNKCMRCVLERIHAQGTDDFFSRMAKLQGWILVFHEWRLSMEHHRWVSISAPDWGVRQPKSVYTSPAETRLFLSKRERWSEPTLASRSERLAKGPHQENAAPVVSLEPVIYIEFKSWLLPTELFWYKWLIVLN